MKALSFLTVLCFMAFFTLSGQSSGEYYSGLIYNSYQPEAYAYGYNYESAVYTQIEQGMKAQVLAPFKRLLSAGVESRAVKQALLGFLLIGLACFFSTFSKRRARRAILPQVRQEPVSKAS